MAVKPSPPPFDPNQKPKPSTGNANDTAKPKPKPGPMPPSIDPPQRPPSKTGFDWERWRASHPQTRVVMPGQGQGPMPIGTRPLPPPVVKDARGGGFDPAKFTDPFYRGTRAPSPEEIAQHEADRAAGKLGGGQGPGNPEGYDWSVGATVGAKPHWNGPPGTEPSGDWGTGRPMPPLGGMGRGGQFDPSRDFKGPPGQGGQQIPPQYGDQQIFGGGPKGSSVDTNYGAPTAAMGDQIPGSAPQGPKMGGWNNQLVEGTPEYGDWMRRMNERNGGAPPSGGKPAQGAPPPQDPGMVGQRPPRPNRPPQGRPPVNPQQMQQGAQELYNDNTIPHEFKGQLLQAAQSGDPQAFNEMLFNSNIPHATKLKLQQMFGYGGQGGAPMQSAQPDQGQQQDPGPYNSQGSPYYGAF